MGPGINARRSGPGQLLGLAGGGVYPAGVVTDAAVRSYRTISPLPVPRGYGAIGRVVSVALSLGLPRMAVSHRRALSCSDFPPRTYFDTPVFIRQTVLDVATSPNVGWLTGISK